MEPTHHATKTLRGRISRQIGVMIVCSLLLGVAAIAGINGLHQDLDTAATGYQQLQQVYEIGFRAAAAKEALSLPVPNRAKALRAIETALLKLDTPSYAYPNAHLAWLDNSKRTHCHALLENAIDRLKETADDDARAPLAQAAAVNDVLGELATLSSGIRTTIDQKQKQADARRHTLLVLIIGWSLAVAVVCIVTGLRVYRSVVQPLDVLGQHVRRFASGKLSERIAPQGDREFAALADDFNWMANELEGLYRELEQKVDEKSRQLVRSMHLASVGSLAAGVAHEINNPLSIITGYGERLLVLLDVAEQGILDDALRNRTRSSMKIICEEAFRCKEITSRLLSLARPGSSDHRAVPLLPIVKQVIHNITGLPEYADRRVTLVADTTEPYAVVGKDGELKQILINLLLNALDAVPAVTGRVCIELARGNEHVELKVLDNGTGMDPATLDQVFEPFFTQKFGDRPGVGLGLPITQAIVASYGGSITAQSDGPGQGSRFTIRLPAAEKEKTHADH